jgi:hypothetical protein
MRMSSKVRHSGVAAGDDGEAIAGRNPGKHQSEDCFEMLSRSLRSLR